MKGLSNVALGIVTSIGGFLDVGAIATAALAGAAFGMQMLWVLLLGTICVIFLTEMAGRLACVSHHSLVDAVRERCGFRYFSFLLVGEVLVDLLVLAAEMGGVAVALHLVTGIDYRWFVPIVAFGLWLLIWLGTFSIVQNGTSLLVDLLVLAAELGGVAVALHLVTGVDFRWFIPIVAFALWLLIWLGTFSIVQN